MGSYDQIVERTHAAEEIIKLVQYFLLFPVLSRCDGFLKIGFQSREVGGPRPNPMLFEQSSHLPQKLHNLKFVFQFRTPIEEKTQWRTAERQLPEGCQ